MATAVLSISVLLQFVAALPFRFHTPCLSQTVRFLLLLNSTIDLPGFGVEPVQRLVTYRHALLAAGADRLDESLVAICIARISANLKAYGPNIEEIGSGRQTLEDAFRMIQAAVP